MSVCLQDVFDLTTPGELRSTRHGTKSREQQVAQLTRNVVAMQQNWTPVSRQAKHAARRATKKRGSSDDSELRGSRSSAATLPKPKRSVTNGSRVGVASCCSESATSDVALSGEITCDVSTSGVTPTREGLVIPSTADASAQSDARGTQSGQAQSGQAQFGGTGPASVLTGARSLPPKAKALLKTGGIAALVLDAAQNPEKANAHRMGARDNGCCAAVTMFFDVCKGLDTETLISLLMACKQPGVTGESIEEAANATVAIAEAATEVATARAALCHAHVHDASMPTQAHVDQLGKLTVALSHVGPDFTGDAVRISGKLHDFDSAVRSEAIGAIRLATSMAEMGAAADIVRGVLVACLSQPSVLASTSVGDKASDTSCIDAMATISPAANEE